MCDTCGRGYTTLGALRMHMRIHTGDVMQCSFCDKTYVNRALLEQHLRTHTREKAFECRQCGKVNFCCHPGLSWQRGSGCCSLHLVWPIGKMFSCRKVFFWKMLLQKFRLEIYHLGIARAVAISLNFSSFKNALLKRFLPEDNILDWMLPL